MGGIDEGHAQPCEVTDLCLTTGTIQVGEGPERNGTTHGNNSGGGGGWGAPEERSIELIERDIQRGYVTPERAASDYGVRIDGVRITRD